MYSNLIIKNKSYEIEEEWMGLITALVISLTVKIVPSSAERTQAIFMSCFI